MFTALLGNVCAWVTGGLGLRTKPADFMREVSIVLACSGGRLLSAARRPPVAPSPEMPPLL